MQNNKFFYLNTQFSISLFPVVGIIVMCTASSREVADPESGTLNQPFAESRWNRELLNDQEGL